LSATVAPTAPAPTTVNFMYKEIYKLKKLFAQRRYKSLKFKVEDSG
jgi:hypothetical protein